ncbi:MAG: DUF4382 domain-containing protein [Cyclobacteriaceae bacterium]|nr:DUF4382 domain-containing protein [Cyclobacteriaceae bacterium]
MKNLLILFFAITMSFMTGCIDSKYEGRFIIRLTDSPGDYEEVNIELVGIQANTQDKTPGSVTESGWIDLDAIEGTYNLLDLTDGAEVLIADSKLPAGSIKQIRLILGENNTVVIDGQSHDLTTPSAQLTGLKINVDVGVDVTLLEGINYSLLLDFDAAKSVVKSGASGKYILKPVVKAVTQAKDGAIRGTVLPAEQNVAIYAMIGEDTLGTTYAIENNAEYFLGGLDAGTYNVVFDPGELSGYKADTIRNVTVVVGEITDIAETVLVP